MNKFDMMREAVSEAETTMRAADIMAVDMAKMLVGRLRSLGKYHPRVSEWQQREILKALKRELRDFNSNTGRWK